MSVEREGTFYPVWPNIDGKNLNMQWGEIRSNTAETKAIVRNSVQDLEDGVDELNALRALLGQEYGDLDFRNKFRFFYNKTTFELCCQKNDGTVDVPVWIDAWCVRFTDGQFQAVGTGGIQSDAGFYGPGLSSIGEVGETGSAADNTVLNPTKIFFNTDDGLEVETISSGANAGAPEIRFTQPFGRAETFSKVGSEWTVAHNFDASPVLVQLYDDDDRVIFPDKADVSDPNTAYFYFHAATTGKVTIATGGTGAASLVPRDPFYIVIRSDGQPAAEHTLEPNADMIFDATQFYVNVDLDTDTGGSHKKAFVSIHSVPSTGLDHGGLQGLTDDDHTHYALADGTRDITGHQRFDDTINVENSVTAEAFYVESGGELSKAGVFVPDGLEATPSVSFQSAPSSGMFLDGVNPAFVKQGSTIFTLRTSDVQFTQQLNLQNGSAAAPALRFSGAATTGLFRSSPNHLGITVQGDQAAVFGPNGLGVDKWVTAEAFYVTSSSNQITDAQFLAEDGVVGAPSYAFTATPTTGMFIDGNGNLNLVRDGAVKLLVRSSDTVSSTNAIVIGNGNVTTPSLRSTGSSDTGIFFEGETFSITANGSRAANFGIDGVSVTNKMKAEAFYVTGSNLEFSTEAVTIPAVASTRDNAIYIGAEGMPYVFDPTRSKKLSVARQVFHFGKTDATVFTNEAMSTGPTLDPTGEVGHTMPRDGTITAVWGMVRQCDTDEMDMRWTLNDGNPTTHAGSLVTLSFYTTAANASVHKIKQDLDIDITRGDFIQAIAKDGIDSGGGGALAYPAFSLEIAWKDV